MNHQPFEDWIFEDELTPEQQSELKAHLSTCEECRQLHSAMKSLSRVFENPVELSPRADFSLRWEKFAEERKEQEDNMAAWIVLGALLIVAGAILFANFGALWFADFNPLQFAVTQVVDLVASTTRIIQLVSTARSVLEVIPTAFIVIIAVAASVLAFFWISVWLAAMKRISSVQRRVE
jgi:anti-sigma factor RsiW